MNTTVSARHITNGDAVAVKLRTAFAGPVSITADVLHEGPAAAVDGAEWREQRAQYLAAAGYTTIDDARLTLGEWDAALAGPTDHDEVVLWFEHDLFDQLALIRTLDLLGALRGAARPARLSLICINAYLGHLSAAELHALWPTRAPVTDAQFEIARRVWRAYRLPDPVALIDARQQLKSERDYCLPLPFLGEALERFFEEYPSTTNGLSRTAATALQVLDDAGTSGEAGALTGAELFRRTQARERRIFLGDTGFFHVVRDMAHACVPLLAVTDTCAAPDPATWHISMTDAGRAVRRAEHDAVRLNGLDEWRGGVHLSGREAAWRWDPARKTLVSCQ